MRRKFAGIETIPLAFTVPDRVILERPKRARPVAWGKCPLCLARPREGVLRQGRHLIWRPHRFKTWAGTDMDCGASGTRVCEARPKGGHLQNADKEKSDRTTCTCLKGLA
jgi:hypothetical protein